MKKVFELESHNGGVDEGTLMVSVIDIIANQKPYTFTVENVGLCDRESTYLTVNDFVHQFSYECWCARNEQGRYAQSLTIWANDNDTLDIEIVWRKQR